MKLHRRPGLRRIVVKPFLLPCIASLLFFPSLAAAEMDVAVPPSKDDREIEVHTKPFWKYHFKDARIKRPFLAHLHAPDGTQVTRNHPPKAGDAGDHDTMHPGLWLAFGDLGGADFWRNNGTVTFV